MQLKEKNDAFLFRFSEAVQNCLNEAVKRHLPTQIERWEIRNEARSLGLNLADDGKLCRDYGRAGWYQLSKESWKEEDPWSVEDHGSSYETLAHFNVGENNRVRIVYTVELGDWKDNLSFRFKLHLWPDLKGPFHAPTVGALMLQLGIPAATPWLEFPEPVVWPGMMVPWSEYGLHSKAVAEYMFLSEAKSFWEEKKEQVDAYLFPKKEE